MSERRASRRTTRAWTAEALSAFVTLDFQIHGSVGDDRLSGMDGAETLVGGAGDGG